MRGFRRWLREGSFVSYFRRGNRWVILLICMLVSFSLWMQFMMQEKHAKEIQVKLLPPDLPTHFTFSTPEQLPTDLTVILTGDGASLLSFSMATLFQPRPTVQLSADSVLLDEEGGRWVLDEVELTMQIEKAIPAIANFINSSSTDESKQRSISITPSRITADYAPLTGRTMPIAFTSQVNFGSKNLLLRSFKMSPDVVRIYGIRGDIDSLQRQQAVIETDTIPIQVSTVGVSEYKVALLAPEGIRLQPDSIVVQLDTEMLVYDEMTVGEIEVDNLPKHYELRLFPHTVQVTFLVPTDSLSADGSYKDEIELFVDVNEITNGQEKKLTVQIRKVPKQVYMMQLNPGQVEYILEEPKRRKGDGE